MSRATKRILQKSTCLDCGSECTYGARRCRPCFFKARRAGYIGRGVGFDTPEYRNRKGRRVYIHNDEPDEDTRARVWRENRHREHRSLIQKVGDEIGGFHHEVPNGNR